MKNFVQIRKRLPNAEFQSLSITSSDIVSLKSAWQSVGVGYTYLYCCKATREGDGYMRYANVGDAGILPEKEKRTLLAFITVFFAKVGREGGRKGKFR